MTPGLKIIFFVTEDWYFCSHRLPLALAAQQTGYDVPVITRVKQHGLKLIPIKLSHRSQNPLKELDVIRQLLRIYREQRPGIVHHVALKTDKLRKQLSRPPPALIERPKVGLALPLANRLRGPLRDWAESLLDESRLRREGYFNPLPIRRKWSEHLTGERN